MIQVPEVGYLVLRDLNHENRPGPAFLTTANTLEHAALAKSGGHAPFTSLP
jgi:hypothetical protein